MGKAKIRGGSKGFSKKLIFFLVGIFVVIVGVLAVLIFSGKGGASDFYGDTDKDGIINGNDPDANGDGIIENFGAGGGGGAGGGVAGSPGGDSDGDGTPNINDPDIDGDGIPNGNDPDPSGNSTDPTLPDTNPPANTTEEIGEASCENYRISRGMDNSYFSLDFSSSECFALANSNCNYGDAFTDNYQWNNQLKCCVWKCTFEA